MRITKIICNKCKQEIEGYPVQLIPVFTNRETGDMCPDEAGSAPGEEEQEEADYCVFCTEKIIAFANGMVEKAEFKALFAEAEAVPPEPTPKSNDPVSDEHSGNQGKKTRIDVGKVMALRKAGWTVKQIADEMGVSDKGIYYVLDKLKKEGKLEE